MSNSIITNVTLGQSLWTNGKRSETERVGSTGSEERMSSLRSLPTECKGSEVTVKYTDNWLITVGGLKTNEMKM